MRFMLGCTYYLVTLPVITIALLATLLWATNPQFRVGIDTPSPLLMLIAFLFAAILTSWWKHLLETIFKKPNKRPNLQEEPKQQKLDRFRAQFLNAIADGSYPPERQQQLFLACQQTGLDWNEARVFVRPEAQAFFNRIAKHLSPAEFQRLQRRLGLDGQPVQLVQIVQPPETPKAKLLRQLGFVRALLALSMNLTYLLGALLILSFALCMAIYFFSKALTAFP